MRVETVYNSGIDGTRIGQQGGRSDGTVPLYSNCHECRDLAKVRGSIGE